MMPDHRKSAQMGTKWVQNKRPAQAETGPRARRLSRATCARLRRANVPPYPGFGRRRRPRVRRRGVEQAMPGAGENDDRPVLAALALDRTKERDAPYRPDLAVGDPREP